MNFQNHIEQAGRRTGRSKAFCDFLTFAVCALSMQKKEDEYLKLAAHYSKDEMMCFSHAFSCMVVDMDDHGQGLKDCLGDYFMEILSNERRGQFFTPECLCDFMAQITNPAEDWQTVSDCCCGSGRMFLSAAKINRNLEFWGADIDLQCCQMTIINLCLNGLKGCVSHMDSLKKDEWHRWNIEVHPLFFIPYIREIDLSKIENKIIELKKVEIKPIEIKPVQTSLDSLFASVELML